MPERDSLPDVVLEGIAQQVGDLVASAGQLRGPAPQRSGLHWMSETVRNLSEALRAEDRGVLPDRCPPRGPTGLADG